MTTLTEQNTSKTAKVGDITLHYNEAGEGDALIMIHGGGPGAAGWSNFRHNIGVLSQSYRVLLVDMPGFGKSDKPFYDEPQGVYTARAFHELMDQLGIDKAHFIGNSLGGHVSMKFALDYPDRAGRLILMAPAMMVGFTTPLPSEGSKLLRSYYQPPGPSVERLRAFLSTLVYDSSWLTDALIEERYQSSIEPELMEWATKMGPRPGRIEPLMGEVNKIEQSTLLVWGRDDRVVPLDSGLFLLQRMPDARLHVFSRCGHWAMVERPNEFNSLCLDFLSQS